MRCPFCGASESRVTDSRSTDEGSTIRRRRECAGCKRRFTTYERVEEVPLMVAKKDGRREAFSRAKLRNGLMRAGEKRPVSTDQVDELVHEVESELRNSMAQEVESRVIGEMAIDRLRRLDDVAYVRFASVYRDFKDIGNFVQEIEELLRHENG